MARGGDGLGWRQIGEETDWGGDRLGWRNGVNESIALCTSVMEHHL